MVASAFAVTTWIESVHTTSGPPSMLITLSKPKRKLQNSQSFFHILQSMCNRKLMLALLLRFHGKKQLPICVCLCLVFFFVNFQRHHNEKYYQNTQTTVTRLPVCHTTTITILSFIDVEHLITNICKFYGIFVYNS